MGTRRIDRLLWFWFVLTILVSMTIVNISFSAQIAVLSAPIIMNTALTPGSTVSIDVSIKDVENLWGFSFALGYNTTILTATNYSSYEPFTKQWPCLINNTGGYVYLAFSKEMGTIVGETYTENTPIAKIGFTVEEFGTCRLEIIGEKLTEPGGIVITRVVSDGLFANIEIPLHDIAITDVTAPSAVSVDEEVTITVAVKNEGDFDETFDVSLYYNVTLIETKTDVILSVGADTTLTFNWDTTGVAEGTYIIKAEAIGHPDEVDTADNIKTVEITVGEEQAPPTTDFTLYVVAGVVIVIAIATVVYMVKFRKPKPE